MEPEPSSLSPPTPGSVPCKIRVPSTDGPSGFYSGDRGDGSPKEADTLPLRSLGMCPPVDSVFPLPPSFYSLIHLCLSLFRFRFRASSCPQPSPVLSLGPGSANASALGPASFSFRSAPLPLGCTTRPAQSPLILTLESVTPSCGSRSPQSLS